MANILITGGSGLIGSKLTAALLDQGFAVRHLGRSVKENSAVPTFAWNIDKKELDDRALEGVDHIIHLSGAGIADKRWTDARMRDLYNSRVDAALLLLEHVKSSGARPKTFISASGINYYGAITSDHVFTETDTPANDTIGKLTQAWEIAADAWADRCRVVKLRTSMVLAKEGGALPKLSAPARYGLSAPLGSGRQWMTWVHIDDLVRIYVQAITDDRMHGAYNVAADDQLTNKTFMRALADSLHKPFFLPSVPGFALRMALGQMSALLLEGSRASNAKLRATGFAFDHPHLLPALKQLLDATQ